MFRRVALVALLLLVSAFPLALHEGAARPIVQGAPLVVRAIEGHTVLHALTQETRSGNDVAQPAPAVLSMVPGALAGTPTALGPPIDGGAGGVRWANDQLLVPVLRGVGVAVLVRDFTAYDDGTHANAYTRYPCSGALYATDAGTPDPRAAWSDAVPPAYVRSLLVTDPSDHTWIVDEWTATDAAFGAYSFWTEPLADNAAGAAMADDGLSSCQPFADESLAAPTGDNGLAYPDGGVAGPGHFQYNGLFVIPMESLHVQAPAVTHLPAFRAGVPSVCVETCPRGDPDVQGNSHSFDPWSKLGEQTAPDGGVVGAWGHEARELDLYYGTMPTQPSDRQYYVVDTEGSTAAFPK